MTYDVIIIGGGASGLIAAITVKNNNPAATVLVVERESRVGKKLLATGNGRCNITNKGDWSGRYRGDVAFAQQAFAVVGFSQTEALFNTLGVPMVELEESKCYPRCLQAGSVVDQLRFAAQERMVEIQTEVEVIALTKNTLFTLTTKDGRYQARQVLVATGGKAGIGNQPATGYDLLTSLGHTLTPLYPGIVQLTCKQPIKGLAGIKTNGNVTLTVDNQTRTQAGEILFTEYGISGPPVLQLSSLLQGRTGEAQLDLLPDVPVEDIVEEIKCRSQRFSCRTCEDLLTGFVNKRLGQTAVKRAGVEKLSRLCGDLTEKEMQAIAKELKEFTLTVTGTKGFAQAQVTVGGISPQAFCSTTMESSLCAGLFAAGEVLNVHGDCGGFNLQWAWTSGILAGRAMAKGGTP